MNRQTFLQQSIKLGALAFLPTFPFPVPETPSLLQRLLTANDRQTAKLLTAIGTGPLTATRQTGFDLATLAAAWYHPASQYHHHPQIPPALTKLIEVLTKAQAPDGTLNFANLESPPDTAFLVDPLATGAWLLKKDDAPELKTVNEQLKTFLQKTGDALSTGGVHTPNHRWVICTALARVNALYPDKKYTDRIEDWLGEGIFMDADGHFPERSGNYSIVEDTSLLTMGRLLHQPALFEPAKKNLSMTWFYMDPDGTLITTDSRRQDQYKMKKAMAAHYLHYRYLAIKDNDPHFSGIARLIENQDAFEEEILDTSFFHFCENELLQHDLPAATTPSTDYEKFFPTSHLLRIRRGSTLSTLFGGVDWPLIITSGRSDSPDLFSFRKDKALLKYMRLSADFFTTGYFYSEGMRKEGNSYVLHKKMEVPYYQPLPKQYRKPDGDYLLAPAKDDRFWNKMDYQHRPVSNVKTLDTTITFTEKNTGSNATNELHIHVTGQTGVPVTIELCFAENGHLSGVTPAPGNRNHFLEKDMGSYESGGNTIRFGPGTLTHKNITGLEGERYSTHFGTLHADGLFVYLTGTTPFDHTLVFS